MPRGDALPLLARIHRDIAACLGPHAGQLFPVTEFPDDLPVLDSFLFMEHAGCAVFSALRAKITGESGQVDPRHALLALRGERYLKLSGKPVELWDVMSGIYRCKDGSQLMAQCNFPHHRRSFLCSLGLDPVSSTRQQAEAAALKFDTASAMERVCLDQGAVVGAVRDAGEPNSPGPLIGISRRTGSSKPATANVGAPQHRRIRVLDCTRVLAGPVLAQTLCEAGFDVVTVTTPELPQIEPARLYAGWGKRSCFMRAGKWEDVQHLASTCDVLVQSMSPGKSAALEAMVSPECVVVNVRAYAHSSERSSSRGFDSVVQCTSGMFKRQLEWTNGKDGMQPAQALDHLTGLLGALAILHCLERRTAEGGTPGFRIDLSLERTAQWLLSLGAREQRSDDGLDKIHKTLLPSLWYECQLDDGRTMRTIRTPLQLGRAMLSKPEAVMGKSQARWRDETAKL